MSARDVVNEKDEVVGQAPEEEIEARHLICRVAFIMLINGRGELLLHRRSANMKAYPLHWSGAAAGHVASGETYEQAAAREMKEEIGVETEIELIGKFYSKHDREMVGVFFGHYDGPITVEPTEVDRIEYFTPRRLERKLATMKVTSYVERALPLVNSRLANYQPH